MVGDGGLRRLDPDRSRPRVGGVWLGETRGGGSPPERRKGTPRSDELVGSPLEEEAGGDVLSHRVSPAVPSALRGLTAVFGMGTGVALAL